MKKVTFALVLFILFTTAVSTIAGDSTGLPSWLWSSVTVNPVGGGTSRSKYFTASGTWTVPTNVSLIWVTAWGGGGGGGGGQNNNGWGICTGGGGGSSAFVSAFPLAVTAGGTVTITIGVGGPGGPANGNGSYGGTTTVSGSGYSVSVPGGEGGCGYTGCIGFPVTNCSGGFGGSPNYWTGGAMSGINGNNGLLSSLGTQGGTGGAGYNGPGGVGSGTGNGGAAAANTGAGGGGAKYNMAFEGYVGGAGGSGGVILAWIQ